MRKYKRNTRKNKRTISKRGKNVSRRGRVQRGGGLEELRSAIEKLNMVPAGTPFRARPVQNLAREIIEELQPLLVNGFSEEEKNVIKMIGHRNNGELFRPSIIALENEVAEKQVVDLINEGAREVDVATRKKETNAAVARQAAKEAENRVFAEKADALRLAEIKKSDDFFASNTPAATTYKTAITAFQNLLRSKSTTAFEDLGQVRELVQSLQYEQRLYDYRNMINNLRTIKMNDDEHIVLNITNTNNIEQYAKGSFGIIYKSKAKNIVYKKLTITGNIDQIEKDIRSAFLEAWIQTLLGLDPTYGHKIPLLRGIYRSDKTSRGASSEEIVLYIVMDYVPKTIKDILPTQNNKLDLPYMLPFFKEVGKILSHFKQTYNFFHRDFHYSNILWKDNTIESFMLIDFGFSSIQFFDMWGRNIIYSERIRHEENAPIADVTSMLTTTNHMYGFDVLQLLSSFFKISPYLTNDLKKFILLVCKPLRENLIEDKLIDINGPIPDIMSWLHYLIKNPKNTKICQCRRDDAEYMILVNGINIEKCILTKSPIDINKFKKIIGITPEGFTEACTDPEGFKQKCDPTGEIDKFVIANADLMSEIFEINL